MDKKPARDKGLSTTRICMTCAAAFKSEGKHNRMCNRCRRNPDYQLEPVFSHIAVRKSAK